ncbi:MAG TPA: C4-dicarboxylate ABC transporter substrate-binding protein, partial [Thermosynergistes sp.]|nr:C4-dicarboxylate ABC transporter substrate-binding protein [Thermosynergistes sp.]
MSKVSKYLIFVLCGAILVASQAFAADKTMVIKFAHNGNIIMEDPQNVACYAFEKMVEEKSNGTFDVQIYPAAQLGDARTIIEGVQMGAIEMG